MNAKISVFVICVETIMYLLLHNLHDCTFTVFLYDLCNECIDFASYDDGNAPHVTSENCLQKIRKWLNQVNQWFSDNHTNSYRRCCVRKGVLRNLAKFTGKHLYQSMCLFVNNDHVSIKLYGIEIKSSNSEKLLGKKINSKLNFKEHFVGIIKETSRITITLNSVLHLILMLLREGYWWIHLLHLNCIMVWMCQHGSVNIKINRLNKRCLRIIYSDKVGYPLKICYIVIEVLKYMSKMCKPSWQKYSAKEVFKVLKNLSNPKMNAEKQNFCNIRNTSQT